MQKSKLAKRAWLLLLLGAGALYVSGLGRLPLVGPDEPRYAQVAREMYARGDAVTPTLGGRTWFEKPALLYWAMMASYGAFGVSEWAARLGSALAGWLTVLLLGWLALRVERASPSELRWTGLASASVLASSAGLIVFSQAASFDAPLTLTVAASLACFLLSELEQSDARRRWLLAGFYAGIGASMLAKGLVGVVICGGVVTLYLLMRRAWPGWLRLGLPWGLPLALVVAATWYAPVIARHDGKFIQEFFVQHHFARYVSNKYNHPQPFYFYLPILALLALPWTLFLVAGINDAARANWRAEDGASRLRAFSLAWVVVPLAFFSVSGSKLPGYILPALPGAALLAGERLARYARGEGSTTPMRLTGVLVLLALGGIAYGVHAQLVSLACGVAVALPLAFVAALLLVWPHRRVWCAASLVAATFLSVALILACGLGEVGERQSTRGLLERARVRGYGSTPVLQLHNIERTSEFYAAGRLDYGADGQPVKLEGAGEVLEAARRKGGQALVLVPLEYVRQLTDFPALDAELVGDNGNVALVAVRVR